MYEYMHLNTYVYIFLTLKEIENVIMGKQIFSEL